MRAGDTHGRLKHVLAIEGLSRSLLIHILDNAERFAPVGDRAVKKVPLLHNNGQIFLGGDRGEGDDRAHREVDALAMSEPVPADEFGQRVNW